MNPEVKKKIAEKQKARWAAKKAAEPVAVSPAELRARISLPVAPPAPPPLDPVVLAFRQQLVPLVEKRENIQQHVRQSQRVLQDAQIALQNDQQALQDTEAQIQYRLNMIAQLTGQPAQQMPTMAMPQFPMNTMGPIPSHFGDVYPPAVPFQAPANTYQGPEVNLMGNPNIPPSVTSVPAPQNQRYASGYVSSGPDNPRSESAVDVREDPAAAAWAMEIIELRKAQAAV